MSKCPVCDDNNELMYNKKYVEVKWYSAPTKHMPGKFSLRSSGIAGLSGPLFTPLLCGHAVKLYSLVE